MGLVEWQHELDMVIVGRNEFKFVTTPEIFQQLTKNYTVSLIPSIANKNITAGIIHITTADQIKQLFPWFISGKIIFYRSREVMQAYNLRRQELTKLHSSVEEYIFDSVLGARTHAFVLNEFPAFVEVPQLQEYLLWYTGDLSEKKAESVILNMLSTKKIGYTDFVFGEFALNFKSVPQIPHYHVYLFTK